MSHIQGQLDLRRYQDDPRHWTILHRIKFYTDDSRSIEIRPHFRLDGGSVPRSAWTYVPPMGTEADWGFVVHDALYAWHRDNSPYIIVSDPFTRQEADKVMREFHLHLGMRESKANLIYTAVRRGASYSWMNKQERKKYLAKRKANQLPEYYDQ